MKEFKYKTEPFLSYAKVIYPEDDSKGLALASLESLKGIIPDKIDLNGNPDVVFSSCNAAVANRVNKNGDSISNEDALNVYKNFIYKFCDLEHKRDLIVGSIINAGFSVFGSNEILTEEDVKNSKDPVNICLASVVWRVLNEQFADMLTNASDETSILYNSVSMSWELAFSDYHILLGSKNLSEAELITDEKQISEFSKFLKVNKGSGMTKDKVPVYRKIVGDMYPLGVGFVKSPAADVKGVIVAETIEAKEIAPEVIEVNSIDNSIILSQQAEISAGQAIKDLTTAIQTFTNDNLKTQEIIAKLANVDEKFNESKEILIKNQNNIKNIATENKKCVNKDTNLSNINKNYKKPMKLKLQEITKDTLESIANVDLYELAKDINEQSTKFAVERDAKAAEADLAKKEVADVKAKNEALAADLEKVKAELSKLEESRAKEKIQNDFNLRMSDLKDKYTLDAAQSKSIAKQIRGLDDETFASWLEDHSAFLVAKEMPEFIKEKMDSKKEGDKSKEGDKKEDEKECKAKKESCASLIEEIKALKPETKPIENKIVAKKTAQEIWAEAFAGIAELNDEKVKQ